MVQLTIWRRSSVLAAIAVTALAAPAAGDTVAPLYAKMKQRFTVTRAGAATGWTFDGALKPVPAGTQVPPQRRVDFSFPPGTRVDLRGVPSCSASDEQIAADGAAACPAGSRIGSGTAGLALGTSGTLETKLAAFAGKQRIILVFMTNEGSVVRVLGGTILGHHVKATLPQVVLGDGSEVAVTRLHVALRRAGTRAHPLLRTPATCPRSGRWMFTYLPRYDAPYALQRSTSSMRCAHA